jgi:hypothetical protein
MLPDRDVGGNAIDQQLDRIDLALAIKAAEGELAAGCALVEIGDEHAGQPTDQLPRIIDVGILRDIRAERINRGDDVGGRARHALGSDDNLAANGEPGV